MTFGRVKEHCTARIPRPQQSRRPSPEPLAQPRGRRWPMQGFAFHGGIARVLVGSGSRPVLAATAAAGGAGASAQGNLEVGGAHPGKRQ